MSKNKKSENKLALVPAASGAVPVLTASPLAGAVALPKGARKLSMPSIVKLDSIPLGSQLSLKILEVVPSVSSREDMKGSKLFRGLHEASATEVLLPISGTIKKAVGGFEGAEKIIGKTLILIRLPDGETEKYGGKKKVYMFDIYVV